MSLATIISELLDAAEPAPLKADDIRRKLTDRATRVTIAGPQLETPPWARAVRSEEDLYLDLSGALEGAHLWDDARGWGTYAELAVRAGTLAEVEGIVGPTSPVPRAPDDFESGETRETRLQRGGRTQRVFVELDRDGSDNVRRVTLHYK